MNTPFLLTGLGWVRIAKHYDLGQHFHDLGHSFSLYGPPSRPITYTYLHVYNRIYRHYSLISYFASGKRRNLFKKRYNCMFSLELFKKSRVFYMKNVSKHVLFFFYGVFSRKKKETSRSINYSTLCY